MRTVFLAALIALFATSAQATNLPKEVWAFRDVTVSFSKNAGNCNITDPDVYANRLREGLGGIGIKENPDVALVAHLAISANGIGPLNTQCTSQVNMSFQTVLRADNIVTDNERQRRIVDRLGVIPITVYQIGMFGVQSMSEPTAGGKSMKAHEAVLQMIDKMIVRFGEARK